MKLSPRPFNRTWKHIVIILLVFIYTAINLFRIGGDGFVIALNNNIANPLALGVSIMAFILWRRLGVTGRNRLLWSGLTLGWILWTVAEIWWGIAGLINQEIPYPSVADFFWVVGYIPMFIALWERSHSLPETSPFQKASIWFSIFFSTGWTIFFVIIPIIQSSDPSAFLENALSITYPVGDLITLIMVLRIFFTYRQGMYGRAWSWISAGFILVSLSDLIFSYATTAGLYYPDRQANLLSTIGVELPYTMGYLFWLIGLTIVWNIQKSYQTREETPVTLDLVPNTHLLIFTKEDDTVTSVSLNYWRVFQHEFVQGKKITEVIGCSPEFVDVFLNDVKSKKVIGEQCVSVQTRSGVQQAKISGVSASNLKENDSGVILLVRIFSEDYYLDELLTDYQHSMVSSLLAKTGTLANEEEEIKQLLSGYRVAFLSAFYNRILSEGGSILADTFLTELNLTAEAHGWQVNIYPDNLLDVSELPLSKTREAVPTLYETAIKFVTKITDESITNSIIQEVQSFFEERVLKNISHFETSKAMHA